jgi:hypothetical protein
VLFNPLDPGSGLIFSGPRMNYLYEGFLIKPERARKIVVFNFHPSFFEGSGMKKGSDPEWKNVQIHKAKYHNGVSPHKEI